MENAHPMRAKMLAAMAASGAPHDCEQGLSFSPGHTNGNRCRFCPFRLRCEQRSMELARLRLAARPAHGKS